MLMRFLKIVTSPACGKNRMCSHPCTSDAIAEKTAEKCHEKFNELIFLQQNHGLHQNLSPGVATTTCWRCDNAQKHRVTIASKKSLM